MACDSVRIVIVNVAADAMVKCDRRRHCRQCFRCYFRNPFLSMLAFHRHCFPMKWSQHLTSNAVVGDCDAADAVAVAGVIIDFGVSTIWIGVAADGKQKQITISNHSPFCRHVSGRWPPCRRSQQHTNTY